MISDLTVHAWDLGTAIGYRDGLPNELAEFVYDTMKDVDLSGSGMFKPPVDVPDDAPIVDKLVAAAGRQPH
jgi:hypothetical protein